MPKAVATEALAAGQSWMLIKSLTEEYVLSLDLTTDSESALIIVSGNEFQTVGAEQRKARLAKSVLVNGLSVMGPQTSEVSVHWREPWCDDSGMSVLWRCCDSWRSTQSPCTWFCVELATNAAHAVMVGHEIVLESGEWSWLECFGLDAEPECCWLEQVVPHK